MLAASRLCLPLKQSRLVTRLPPRHILGLAMEVRKISCNVRSTLNSSYPGVSTKMLLVPLQMAYALMAARLPMRWTLAILIRTKHSELMHPNLSESNIAKSQRVSHSYIPFYPFTFAIFWTKY